DATRIGPRTTEPAPSSSHARCESRSTHALVVTVHGVPDASGCERAIFCAACFEIFGAALASGVGVVVAVSGSSGSSTGASTVGSAAATGGAAGSAGEPHAP